jgi:hypothetical protein
MESKKYRCEEKEDEYRDAKISFNVNNEEFFKKICHDIRNSKQFSREIIEQINNLSYDNRIQILSIYNEMFGYYLSLLNEE